MLSLRRAVLLSLILLASIPSGAVRPETPNIPPIPHLPALSHSSGYIFTGTVKSVEFEAGDKGGIATMRVTFQVEQGIRGVSSGQLLTIREWIGLWQAGERYRAGEGVALFLYPPSKLGLTSPVGGTNGRFSLDPGGNIVVKPGRGVVFPRRDHASEPILINPRDLIYALGRPEGE